MKDDKQPLLILEYNFDIPKQPLLILEKPWHEAKRAGLFLSDFIVSFKFMNEYKEHGSKQQI